MSEEAKDQAGRHCLKRPLPNAWPFPRRPPLPLQVAVMPVRVVWGNSSMGLLFATEMVLSVLLCFDVLLSFHTGEWWGGRVGCSG